MSASWAGRDEDEDEAGEDEEQDDDRADDTEETRWLNKDSILFAIDCSEDMLEPAVDGGDSPLRCALRGASRVYQNKIIAGVDDLVGVILFGAANAKNDHSFDGLHVVQELGVPDAPGVSQLEQLQDPAVFAKTIGHAQQIPSLEKVLWAASMLFSKCAIKVGSKRIFFFTNNDDPNAGDAQGQTTAKRKAQDLAELGIEIELFSMNRPEHKFDVAKFYAQILSIDEDDMADHYPAGADKLDQIFDQLRKKEYKKRTMARLPFFLSDKMEIAVRVFNLVGEAKKGAFTYMDPMAQNAEVKALTKYVTNTTGQIVSRKDLRSYIEYGGERVVFETDELSKLRTVGEPGLLLMGFKPRSAVHRKHFLKAGPFIYPNDHDVRGSSTAFAALIDSLLRKDKVAICRLIARSHTLPRFVALIPQREEVSATGVQEKPPGMHIVYLPFNDDIRKLAHEPVNKAKDDDVRRFQAVVKKLTLKGWVPVENPTLQRHYQTLQLIALNQDVPEEIADATMPQIDNMKARAGPAIDAFLQGAFPDGWTAEVRGTAASRTTAASKRKAAASADGEDGGASAGGRAKKVKAPVTEDDVKQMVANGSVGKLTIAELKDFLKGVGVKAASTDKKDDLVRKAEAYFA